MTPTRPARGRGGVAALYSETLQEALARPLSQGRGNLDEGYAMTTSRTRATHLAHMHLTQRDAIRAYRLLIKGERVSSKDRQHFISVFNALLLHRWSLSGLRRIKEQAWKDEQS